MLKDFLITLLGGFLAAGSGLLVFYIQRCREKLDKQQNLLYRIYHLIQKPVGGNEILENAMRWQEVESLSFLLDDTKLGRELFTYAKIRPFGVDDKINAVLEKITSKLNKKLIKELQASISNDKN